MIARWFLMAMCNARRAAPSAPNRADRPRACSTAVWKQAECNQPIDMALNNARYHELGGGYSLGMVLCWLGPHAESLILFLVAPRTGGKPQLLRFQEWGDKKFVPADVALDGRLQCRDEDDRQLSALQLRAASARTAGEWTWTGTEFKMTGYWDKPDCDDERVRRFDRDSDSLPD